MVRISEVTKRFGSLLANDRISLDLAAGEVHAILGENGAGKSTLVKILYGLHQPDGGRIVVHGEPVVISSPRVAADHGIGMVHQHFMLVPSFTAVENAVLGLEPARRLTLDLASVTKRLKELSEEYALEIEFTAKTEQMSVGAQQRLEILKMLLRDVRVLILDEPTAVLAPAEVQQLFRIIRKLAAEERSVVFISHKLDEVQEISDRVSVLRDGRLVATRQTSDVNASQLAHMMVGRDVTFDRRIRPPARTQPVLAFQDVSCSSDRRMSAVRGVSLTVHGGEILGIAGVDGNGQTELSECAAGLRRVDSGRVVVEGRPVRQVARARGLGFIPEDRQRAGLVLDLSVAENLMLRYFDRSPFTRWGLLQRHRIDRYTERFISRLRIQAATPRTPVRKLSGGNQQRIMVGRELDGEPQLIIACQPTRGLDIGAIEAIHQMLLQERQRGAAILLISTELNEVLALSDRVMVLFKGEIMGEVDPEDCSLQDIGQMMMGRRHQPRSA